jgi:hypothetical protein
MRSSTSLLSARDTKRSSCRTSQRARSRGASLRKSRCGHRSSLPLCSLLTPLSTPSPQIDKRWKNKLQNSQPSEEALALVTPRDPTIHLNFVSKPLASLSASSVRLAPSSSDLPHGHAFCFDVNLNQIFGEISVSDAWEEAQAAASRRRSRTAKTPLDRRDLSLSFSPFATPLGSFPMA